jgi:Mrp family chromosome partitioning ATPase
MSIVERALQKAQAKAKADAEAATPLAHEPAASPAAPSFGTAPPATAHSPQPSASPDISLTSRDLKALVHIDFDRLRGEGRVPSPAMAAQTEDEIRRIKWPLLKAIEGSEGVKPARNNLVLVTSALPGEGKTFTSLNLALSIVRDRELRVVLVDGDVARPGLTPSLGLDGRPGLIDALEDSTRDVSTITYQTDVEGLFFVPAGNYNPHAPEFFAGSYMPQLMESLSRRVGRGVVIFDSPPLLATNEAQVATRFAGQVVVVVRASETDQQAVLDALALVDKDAPVSAVLNRCKPSLLSRYYGQYYYSEGHGYGSDYGRGRPPAAGKGNA